MIMVAHGPVLPDSSLTVSTHLFICSRFHPCPVPTPQRQRTVYRLTLVKAWNVEEMQAYSELIALGQPDFIEVKVGLSSFLSFQQDKYSISVVYFVKYVFEIYCISLLLLFFYFYSWCKADACL